MGPAGPLAGRTATATPPLAATVPGTVPGTTSSVPTPRLAGTALGLATPRPLAGTATPLPPTLVPPTLTLVSLLTPRSLPPLPATVPPCTALGTVLPTPPLAALATAPPCTALATASKSLNGRLEPFGLLLPLCRRDALGHWVRSQPTP